VLRHPEPKEQKPQAYFVSRDASRLGLEWPAVIERLRAAYSIVHTEKSNPRRSVARDESSWVRSLTSVPSVGRYMGSKVFGLGPAKLINYAIVLIDRSSGLIAGLVDGAPITAMRTAATSALAIDVLARKDASILGVLGSGDEASAHVEAIAHVRQIETLRVYSPAPHKREQFARYFAAKLGITALAVETPQLAVTGAHIVVTAARSRDETPILDSTSLKAGMAIVSIGSTLPEQREIDTSVINDCDLIVCDSLEEVCEETGDLLAAKRAGVAFMHKTISLNQLLCGETNILARCQLPLFKSVGSALQDVVVAGLALERALAAGSATPLPFDFYTKRP